MKNRNSHRILLAIVYGALLLVWAVGIARAADWSNPYPRAGGDSAGQLLLKHESIMTLMFTGTTGYLNQLKANNSGAASPSSPSNGQAWHDSTNNLMKFYNSSWGGVGLYSSATSSFPGGIMSSGTNTWSGTQVVSGGITSSGTNTWSGASTFTTAPTFTVSGTAPFSTNSATVVSNLNADMVDGYHVATTPTPSTIPITTASGLLPEGMSGLVGFRVLSSGSTYTPTAGTNRIIVYAMGGGGGGGQAGATSSAQNSCGAGGSAGSLAIKLYTNVSSSPSYTYSLGTAGSSGLSGSATTFSGPGGTVITGGRGNAGGTVTASTFPYANGNVVTGDGSSNGDINVTGAPGSNYCFLMVKDSAGNYSGGGASSRFGTGGVGISASGAGNNASGYGAGGGGGYNASSQVGAVNGGSGSAGVIVIYEFN